MSTGQASIKVITLQGDLSIQKASAIVEEIQAAMGTTDKLVFDITLAESIDLSCLQILYAAKKTADKKGIELVFKGPVPSEIATALAVGGFCRKPPEDGSELADTLVEFNVSA